MSSLENEEFTISLPLERFHVHLIRLNRGSTLDLPRLNWSRLQNLRLDVRADRDVVYGLLFRLSGGHACVERIAIEICFLFRHNTTAFNVLAAVFEDPLY